MREGDTRSRCSSCWRRHSNDNALWPRWDGGRTCRFPRARCSRPTVTRDQRIDGRYERSVLRSNRGHVRIQGTVNVGPDAIQLLLQRSTRLSRCDSRCDSQGPWLTSGRCMPDGRRGCKGWMGRPQHWGLGSNWSAVLMGYSLRHHWRSRRYWMDRRQIKVVALRQWQHRCRRRTGHHRRNCYHR